MVYFENMLVSYFNNISCDFGSAFIAYRFRTLISCRVDKFGIDFIYYTKNVWYLFRKTFAAHSIMNVMIINEQDETWNVEHLGISTIYQRFFKEETYLGWLIVVASELYHRWRNGLETKGKGLMLPMQHPRYCLIRFTLEPCNFTLKIF